MRSLFIYDLPQRLLSLFSLFLCHTCPYLSWYFIYVIFSSLWLLSYYLHLLRVPQYPIQYPQFVPFVWPFPLVYWLLPFKVSYSACNTFYFCPFFYVILLLYCFFLYLHTSPNWMSRVILLPKFSANLGINFFL